MPRIENIVLFTQRVECNSTCANTDALENRTKNMSVTRIMGSTTASSIPLSPHNQCFSIGSVKMNKKKNKKRVIKISTKISKKEDLKKLRKSALRLHKNHKKSEKIMPRLHVRDAVLMSIQYLVRLHYSTSVFIRFCIYFYSSHYFVINYRFNVNL